MFEDILQELRDVIAQGLKEDCELDTLAIIFLYLVITDLIGTATRRSSGYI